MFGYSTKRGGEFRSGWALCCCRFAFAQSRASWGRPVSRFTREARSRVSGQQMFFARKRECNVATAARCWSRRRYHRMWCF